MRRGSVLSLLFSSALAIGCATTPSAPPFASEDGSGIGMAVKVRPPLALGLEYDAKVVYFVRLDETGRSVDDAIYASNYSKGGRTYLLNTPPGGYVAVAVLFSDNVLGSENTYLVYFPKPLIELTKVSVQEAMFVYAGSYVVDASVGVCPEEADEAQLRYAEKIAPGVPKCGLVRILLHDLSTHPIMIMNSQAYTLGSSTYHYRGRLLESRHELADEREFRLNAGDDLKSAGWAIGLK